MAGASITYYKNDGTNTSFISRDDFFNVMTVDPITSFHWIRDGYNFLYWNTESDGTGTTYNPGDTASEIELYAIWEAIPDNSVHFKTGTFAEYTSADKESNSLYFIADKGIYKGSNKLVSVNADLTIDNTNKNIIITINGNQISANVSQDILDQIADAGIDIGEIPQYIDPTSPIDNGYMDFTKLNSFENDFIDPSNILLVGINLTTEEFQNYISEPLLAGAEEGGRYENFHNIKDVMLNGELEDRFFCYIKYNNINYKVGLVGIEFNNVYLYDFYNITDGNNYWIMGINISDIAINEKHEIISDELEILDILWYENEGRILLTEAGPKENWGAPIDFPILVAGSYTFEELDEQLNNNT